MFVTNGGKGCSWHLMGETRGALSNAKDRAHNKDLSRPNVKCAEVEKPWYRQRFLRLQKAQTIKKKKKIN